MSNKFEMKTFDGESIYFEFNSIIVCNNNIKEQLSEGCIELDVPTPYIIITNNNLTDEEIEILTDATIADCLRYTKAMPAFGGVLV